MIAGAPTRSWEWAVPFSVRPPYTRTDSTGRAFIITPWLPHCCRGQWLDDTKRILHDWHAHPARSWSCAGIRTAASFRRSPNARSCLEDRAEVLLQLDSREALDANILRWSRSCRFRCHGSGLQRASVDRGERNNKDKVKAEGSRLRARGGTGCRLQ